MKIQYAISDIEVNIEFSKVINITEIETDGLTDHKVVLDTRPVGLLLSDIIFIVDDSNNEHTENLLNLLEGYIVK